jgi:hypothetical protein
MAKIRILLVLFISLNTQRLSAQGCSDAGVCSIGGYSAQVVDSLTNGSAYTYLRITLSVASGEQGTLVLQSIPEFGIRLLPNLSIIGRIPLMQISGNLANTAGTGDLTGLLRWNAWKKKSALLSLSAGLKFPSGKTDLETESLSLPMPYQTGLGTTDLLAGVDVVSGKWIASIAWQRILDHNNRNRFLRAAWENNEDAQKYFESAGLIRGDDATLRVERELKLKNIEFAPGLLAIYRLQKDRIVSSEEQEVELKNSDGLTLNITASAAWSFLPRHRLQAQLGFPVVVRETRADGLTRTAVVNIAYTWIAGKKN